MRTIALISEHASPLAAAGGTDSGGQNIYVANLACRLARLGYRIDVYTRRDNRFAPAVVNWRHGVRVVHLDAGPPEPLAKEELLPHMGQFCEGLQRAYQRRPYDLLHANFFMSGLAALEPARRHHLPLVMTFHALGKVRRQYLQEADRFPDSRFRIEEELVRRADCLIAECPQDRSDLLRLYDAAPDRIEVVPCGFDPAKLRPRDRAAARAGLGWPADEFVLLQLGRLVPRKGIDNVIRAVAELRQRHGVRARLYIVGGADEQPDPVRTPEIGRLAEIARGCGVEPNVHFLGCRRHDALSELYSAADVFVTTPWYEPFGITPVEAMACATPVVGARVGGIRSTVVNGVTGLLVPPRDPVALAAALNSLAGDAEARRRMGLAGLNRALRKFTWNQVAARTAGIYDRLLAPQRTWPAAAAGTYA